MFRRFENNFRSFILPDSEEIFECKMGKSYDFTLAFLRSFMSK